jgi:hypothetical protein
VRSWICEIRPFEAEGWYVAYPDLTVTEILRNRRIAKAVDELLDKIGG